MMGYMWAGWCRSQVIAIAVFVTLLSAAIALIFALSTGNFGLFRKTGSYKSGCVMTNPAGSNLPSVPTTLPHSPLAFHLLAKPTGAVCNLDCKYCFFLSKEMLYPGSRFRMADELLETYIRQLLEAQQIPKVTIAWQGGEPTLMGLDFFKRSIKLVEKYKKPGQTVLYTIQTNGTKIDDELAAFFKQHNFLVGLSVDGPQQLHDVYRVNKGGAGSFEQVMRGFHCLQKHAVDVNILCTVHAANTDHPLEIYHFFCDDLGAEYMQFIPQILWPTCRRAVWKV